MRTWKPWMLAAWLAAGASVAVAQSPADAVVQQLREQGYVEFEVSQTLLGRVRVVALAPDGGQREIVFNPATGEILRDYHAAADGTVAPRLLDRSEGEDAPQAASSPSGGRDEDDTPGPGDDEDGNSGHGNDRGGFDDDNPGRGHGDDGTPDDDDGNRGHGNDGDGSDNDNPGRGHGNDGTPGGGNGSKR